MTAFFNGSLHWVTEQIARRYRSLKGETGADVAPTNFDARPAVRRQQQKTSRQRRPSSDATTTTLNSNLGQRHISRLGGKRSPQAGTVIDRGSHGHREAQDHRGARTGGGGL